MIDSKIHDLWTALTLEGRWELIDKLRRAERGDGGFGTIVVPKEGFSDNDQIHNAVIDWLHEHDINVINTRTLIASWTEALRNRSIKGMPP